MHAREIPRTATPPLRRPDRPGSPAVPPKELRISTKRDVVASALTKDLALAGRPAALIAASLGPRSFSDVDAHAPPNKEFLRSVSAPEVGRWAAAGPRADLVTRRPEPGRGPAQSRTRRAAIPRKSTRGSSLFATCRTRCRGRTSRWDREIRAPLAISHGVSDFT